MATPTVAATQYFKGNAGDSAGNQTLEDAPYGSGSNDRATTATWASGAALSWLALNPGSATATAASPSATARGKGWHIPRTQMNGATGTVRVIPAGTVTVNLTFVWSGADTSGGTWHFHARFFKKAGTSAPWTYTEIAQLAGGAESTLSGLSVGLVDTAITLTKVAATEIVFAQDETLHVELYVEGEGATLTALTATFEMGPITGIGTPNGSNVTLPAVIATRSFVTASASSTGTSSFSLIRQFARAFSNTSTGTSSFARVLSLGRTVSGTSAGTASLAKQIGKPLSLVSTGTASLAKQVTKRVTATGTGTASIFKQISKAAFSATATGTSSFVRRLIAARTISATSTGTSSFNRALIFGRLVNAVSTGTVKIFAFLPIDKIPYSTGGTTIIKKVLLAIFDD